MNKVKAKPLVILGGGGHASVLVDILLSQQREIVAIVSPENISSRLAFSGLKHMNNDQDVLAFSPAEVRLVNGIGMLPNSALKRNINEYFLDLGYRFETIISNQAYISSFASIEHGAQVLPGAIIQPGAVIGAHSIINSGAIIEHDCRVGQYNHIAPRATLCGQVTTQHDVFIGAGATIIQNITLGHGSVIGAGAIVTKNVSSGKVCYSSRIIMN
ncbi:acetyltransferase [Shewanella pealeana]|uniref:Sialic acid biosynthesis protein NeuD n=1 Tax=Shewanella pealeana (strain ATCC 700345 / ANG-SQ1) TaxID=398579 RepID=A8GYJ2_SHEPA|nr:acetyltransferase [Shewanella pealeana]ABV85379.1 sialic acid biosynthesis protein NeuD [Shewanella pealeana ATCC 700345]